MIYYRGWWQRFLECTRYDSSRLHPSYVNTPHFVLSICVESTVTSFIDLPSTLNNLRLGSILFVEECVVQGDQWQHLLSLPLERLHFGGCVLYGSEPTDEHFVTLFRRFAPPVDTFSLRVARHLSVPTTLQMATSSVSRRHRGTVGTMVVGHV